MKRETERERGRDRERARGREIHLYGGVWGGLLHMCRLPGAFQVCWTNEWKAVSAIASSTAAKASLVWRLCVGVS